MPHFVALLRGINVGGHKIIRMEALRALFENTGVQAVKTYIQSGNVVGFLPDESAYPGFAEQIRQEIFTHFGFEVKVTLRTRQEMEQIVSLNPYLQDGKAEIQHLHLAFLTAPPSAEAAEALQQFDAGPDSCRIIGKELYLHCPGGYGNTLYANPFLEKKLKVAATTRNWKTVCTVLDLLHA